MTLIKGERYKIEYDILCGSDPIKILNAKPFIIFEDEALLFLSEISKQILNDKKNLNAKDDYLGFSFWARTSNLKRLKKKKNTCNDLRIGRGPTLHIAPSNISANALFTFAFGLISGCPSVIRISSRILQEYEFIFEIINKVSKSKKFINIFNKFSFISYDPESKSNEFFSKNVKARVIWGGNETIEKFRSLTTSPNCIDLIFPNRVSSSIISSNWLHSSSEKQLKNISDLYGRDIGLYSQQACSSPTSLIILNDGKFPIKEKLIKFLHFCDKSLINKRGVSSLQGLLNFRTSIDFYARNLSLKVFFKGINICAFSLAKKEQSIIPDTTLKDCCLIIYEVDSINNAIKLLNKNNQTLICIGLDNEIKKELAFKAGIKGTDRIVNPGNALSMDIFWDGYDIVDFLSRLISIN